METYKKIDFEKFANFKTLDKKKMVDNSQLKHIIGGDGCGGFCGGDCLGTYIRNFIKGINSSYKVLEA